MALVAYFDLELYQMDCWPKRLHSQIVLCFDDDKPNKSYLVLMNLFKISFRFVPCLETICLAVARTSKFHKARKANCTSRKDQRREGSSKALDGSRT